MSAGYRPQVGDTVRNLGGVKYTVKLGPDSDGYWLIEDPDGEWGLEAITDGSWDKVEPTPADRYLAFDDDGYAVTNTAFRDVANARRCAGTRFRVARFSFAGWVDAEGER